MPIDPDAPWIVNAILTALILAGIPALTMWVGGRKQRAQQVQTHALLEETAASAAVAAHEVKPNSGASLADVVDGIAREVREVAAQQVAAREDLGRIERAQRELARDVGGVRQEVRQEREERRDVSRRLDEHILDVPRLTTAVEKAEVGHVGRCPLRRDSES